MTDLESAVLSILRESADKGECAMVRSDILAHLARRGWKIQDIMPPQIMAALIALESDGLARNELCWHAVPQDREAA